MTKNCCEIMERLSKGFISQYEFETSKKKYDIELNKGKVNRETIYEYATCLVRSERRDDIPKGIGFLEDLLGSESSANDRLDVIFHLALGNVRLENLSKGRKYCEVYLKNESNDEVLCMLEYIKKKQAENENPKFAECLIVAGIFICAIGVLIKAKKS